MTDEDNINSNNDNSNEVSSESQDQQPSSIPESNWPTSDTSFRSEVSKMDIQKSDNKPFITKRFDI